MPINKEAFIRYRIIDQCLRNKRKPFPGIFDLIRACEEKLGKSFSERTIQQDIKNMKEDEALGFLAPIKFSKEYKGYCYSDPNFTIASVPLTEEDLDSLGMAAKILKQYQGFGLFQPFDEAVEKIFSAISAQSILTNQPDSKWIQFDEVSYMSGSEHLQLLLNAIKEHFPVSFTYKKFNASESKSHILYPYLLKEYRNRWYVIGLQDKHSAITTYGLDRISNLKIENLPFRFNHDFSPEEYFKYAYAVTVYDGEPEVIELLFKNHTGSYVLTQPMHHSQVLLSQTDKEVSIQICVGVTNELIVDILSYGMDIEVKRPIHLRDKIIEILNNALKSYRSYSEMS